MSETPAKETAPSLDGGEIVAPVEHKQIRINKWRVREGVPVCLNQVLFLYEIPVSEEEGKAEAVKPSKTILKFKSNRTGVVKKRLVKDGAIVQGGTTLLELMECIHTTVIHDMCADCGADLRQNEKGNRSEASVPMVHSIPDLKVTQKLAQKLGQDDTRRLLQDRKLVLLVDLDQTIIHTTNDNVPANIKGIHHFQLYGPKSPWYHTRLRPRTPQFLECMSKLYELHICTFGARNYAHTIAQILDPQKKIFSQRILSRDECFNATSKTDNLKALFPNGDSMVCIIDDREDVWNMASNLIQVKPYHFFQHTGDINAPPGLTKTELDGEGVDFKDLDSPLENSKAEGGDKNISDEDPKSSCLLNVKQNLSEPQSGCNNRQVHNVSVDKSGVVQDEKKTEKTSNEVTESLEEEEDSLSNANQIECQLECNDKKEEMSNECKNSEQKSEETKAIDQDKDNQGDISKLPSIPENVSKEIEIEDPDDYLLYLESILTSIHYRFYSIYDESQEIPDLKIIVPKIRSEVLRGCNLVFSGLVPTNMKIQQSRAYFIAKSLGANVTPSIKEDTTHLVAVTSGTFKVNSAKKNSKIKLVSASWLWTCAERWEHVEEKLFPLDRKVKSRRQPPAHCHSPEHVVNYSDKSEISPSSSAQQNASLGIEKFIDTINPLLAFSNADLADMNEEFDQFFDSNSSSDEDQPNIDNPPINRNLRKRRLEERGEERARKFFTRSANVDLVDSLRNSRNGDGEDETPNEQMNRDDYDEMNNTQCQQDKDLSSDLDDDDETPSERFRRGGTLPSDLEMGSQSNEDSDGCCDDEDNAKWKMMGAALEREFLGLD